MLLTQIAEHYRDVVQRTTETRSAVGIALGKDNVRLSVLGNKSEIVRVVPQHLARPRACEAIDHQLRGKLLILVPGLNGHAAVSRGLGVLAEGEMDVVVCAGGCDDRLRVTEMLNRTTGSCNPLRLLLDCWPFKGRNKNLLQVGFSRFCKGCSIRSCNLLVAP